MKKDVDYELRVTLTPKNQIKTESGVFYTSECSVTRIPVSILRGADKTICYAQPFLVSLTGVEVIESHYKTFFTKKDKVISNESFLACIFEKGVTEIEIISSETDFVKWFEKVRMEIEKFFLLYFEDVFLNKLAGFNKSSSWCSNSHIYTGVGGFDTQNSDVQGILKEFINTDFAIKCQFISHISSLELPSK